MLKKFIQCYNNSAHRSKFDLVFSKLNRNPHELNDRKMSTENNERNLNHLFDGGHWNVYETNILNLGVGAPGEDLLSNCTDIFQKATEHRMKFEREANCSFLFQYGPPNGIFEARSEIAKYFTQMYGNKVKSEDVFITAGASQGLHLILSTLVDFDGCIFVDEVTYMIALDVFKQFNSIKIIPVKLNDDGVDIEQFECALEANKSKSKTKEFWGMYYTIPTYHNPTGMVFSNEICKQLITLARKYDILITCDDVYNILSYIEEHPPKRLFAYDERTDNDYCGNVISNVSFSKIIGPGLRLGWLEAPARVMPILQNCGVTASGGCFNNYTSGVLASLFKLGLAQQHIGNLYDAYKARMLATSKVFEQKLPKGCSMICPQGGYFIWIRLPAEVDSRKFLKYCLDNEKISFIAGTRFSVEGNANNSFRISIAFHSKENLIDGANRICSALEKFLVM